MFEDNCFLVGTPYHQKINFSIFKHYTSFENNAFLTCVSKGIPSDTVIKHLLTLIDPEQKLIISLKNGDVITHPRVICIYNHPKDFHALFNTYIYYHTGYFDPHPRLFHECVFYNKKIIYINNDNIKDGGYYRYIDSQQNGISNKNLDQDDEIVKRFL